VYPNLLPNYKYIMKTIYFDHIINYYPWRDIGTPTHLVIYLDKDDVIIKGFSSGSSYEKMTSLICQRDNTPNKTYSNEEISEYILDNIRRIFIVEEDDFKLILKGTTEEYDKYL